MQTTLVTTIGLVWYESTSYDRNRTYCFFQTHFIYFQFFLFNSIVICYCDKVHSISDLSWLPQTRLWGLQLCLYFFAGMWVMPARLCLYIHWMQLMSTRKSSPAFKKCGNYCICNRLCNSLVHSFLEAGAIHTR